MNKTNLFLLAAPRSGSTQLAAWMSSHKDIGCTFVKEPNYFSSHEFTDDYIKRSHLNDIDPGKIKDVSKHLGKSYQFAIFKKPEQYKILTDAIDTLHKMDASTTYLHCPEAIDNILQYNPEAKFIVLLRNPVARLVSHYRLAIRTGRENRCLAECLKAEFQGEDILPARFLIRQSLYAEALSRIFDKVDSQSIKVVIFENMISNPTGVLSEIAEFLGISAQGFELSVQEKNEGVAPRFPIINRFIATTGIKTYLRSVLPKRYKEKLKKFYFSDEKIAVDLHALDDYQSLFEEDLSKLTALLPELSNYWKLEKN